jgi:hypothetical protein
MAKALQGVLLGFGLLGLVALFEGRKEAHATPGSSCKRWEVQAYRTAGEEELPDGWEPFAVTTRDHVALRRCAKD